MLHIFLTIYIHNKYATNRLQQLIPYLKQGKHEMSSFGHITVRDILKLAALITRKLTDVGMWLSTNLLKIVCRNYEDLRIWVEDYPSCISSAILLDISSLA